MKSAIKDHFPLLSYLAAIYLIIMGIFSLIR